jgi:hypothetical protein
MADPDGLTQDQYDSCLLVPVALNRFSKVWSHSTVKGAILQRIADNEMVAVCRKAVVRQGTKEETKPLYVIPKHFWPDSPAKHDNAEFWTTAAITFQRRASSSMYPDTYCSCTDVRFDAPGIESLLATAIAGRMTEPVAEPTILEMDAANILDTARQAQIAKLEADLAAARATKHPGGKPSHPYWEEAILRVAQRMHLGDFKPLRQAEVGRAIADWIVAAGYEEPGATALKARAKLVFELFKD